jgi:hypothetical protein
MSWRIRFALEAVFPRKSAFGPVPEVGLVLRKDWPGKWNRDG